MSKKGMCKKLYESRKLSSPDQVEIFEEAAVELQDEGGIDSLRCLLKAFDDSTQQKEVMWSLVHGVESFELDLYIKELVAAVPNMIKAAKEWLLVLLKRIISTKKAWSILRKTYEDLEESERKELYELLLEAAEDDQKLIKTVHALSSAS